MFGYSNQHISDNLSQIFFFMAYNSYIFQPDRRIIELIKSTNSLGADYIN